MRTRWRSAPRSGRGPRRSIQFGGTRPRCSFCGVVLLSIVVFGVRRRHGSQAVTQQRSGASGDPSPPGAGRTARRATRCGSAGRARACSSSQSSTGGWSTRAPRMDGCTRTRPIAEQTPVSVHRFGRALRRASHSRSEPHPTDWSMCPCWLRRTSTVTTRCSRSQRIARTDVSRHGPDGFPTGSRPPLLWGTGRSSSARTRPFERTTRGADSRLAVRHGGSARSTATTTSCRRSWATGSLRWHRVRTSSRRSVRAALDRAPFGRQPELARPRRRPGLGGDRERRARGVPDPLRRELGACPLPSLVHVGSRSGAGLSRGPSRGHRDAGLRSDLGGGAVRTGADRAVRGPGRRAHGVS